MPIRPSRTTQRSCSSALRLGDDESAEGLAAEHDRVGGREVGAVGSRRHELEGLHLARIEQALVEYASGATACRPELSPGKISTPA